MCSSDLFVLTSEEKSDDLLTNFLEDRGQQVFRASLNDVLGRYVLFADTFSFSNIVRISADSPLLHPEIITGVLRLNNESRFDLVTNVYPRTFPKGQSVEVFNSDSFLISAWHIINLLVIVGILILVPFYLCFYGPEE